jgi:hypothetical protein
MKINDNHGEIDAVRPHVQMKFNDNQGANQGSKTARANEQRCKSPL